MSKEKQKDMIIEFWGCRGTLPVPGNKTLRYGGNTNCITLNIADKNFFIFDAGTGIKSLGNHLIKDNLLPVKAKIFITHPHYDHINGIPYFQPLYMKGNEFEIFGVNSNGGSIKKVLSGQMDNIYFPVTMKEFAAQISFRDLSEEEFKIDDITIKTILLNHPGKCLGYRVEFNNKSFCYITDNELHFPDSESYNQASEQRLIQFISGTNILVIDTTYTDAEYKTKMGWGHSCVTRVVDIAEKAKVKLLCLHHHDPDETDDDIDAKVKQANELLKLQGSSTVCIAPREGEVIKI